jgi:hypothetical protein
MLDHLSRLRDGRSRRVSSWDTSGRNADAWPIEAGETKLLADLTGAGVIRHIWFTVGADRALSGMTNGDRRPGRRRRANGETTVVGDRQLPRR